MHCLIEPCLSAWGAVVLIFYSTGAFTGQYWWVAAILFIGGIVLIMCVGLNAEQYVFDTYQEFLKSVKKDKILEFQVKKLSSGGYRNYTNPYLPLTSTN